MVRKLKLYLLMATLALSVSGCGKNSETEDAKSTSVSESSDLQNQEEVHSNPESNVLSPISRNNTAFWRAAAETADSLLLRLMIVILQCGHGKCAPSFLPDSGQKKSRIPFQISCLDVPLVSSRYLVFNGLSVRQTGIYRLTFYWLSILYLKCNCAPIVLHNLFLPSKKNTTNQKRNSTQHHYPRGYTRRYYKL